MHVGRLWWCNNVSPPRRLCRQFGKNTSMGGVVLTGAFTAGFGFWLLHEVVSCRMLLVEKATIVAASANSSTVVCAENNRCRDLGTTASSCHRASRPTATIPQPMPDKVKFHSLYYRQSRPYSRRSAGLRHAERWSRKSVSRSVCSAKTFATYAEFWRKRSTPVPAC